MTIGKLYDLKYLARMYTRTDLSRAALTHQSADYMLLYSYPNLIALGLFNTNIAKRLQTD